MILRNKVSLEVFVKRIEDSYELKNEVLTAIPAPLVSVYVPTYQHKNFIEECIESILMQKTDFPFEIIIGEDFSTDGTREIVFNYAENYPEKIRVVTADYNVKELANRVRCLKALRGKYIAQCDGDDYWTDPEKLQKQTDFLENQTEYSICYHAYQVLNNGTLSKKLYPKKSEYSGDELIGFPGAITVSTKFFRNVYANLEDDYYFKFCGDAYTTALLGTFGKGKCLNGINPSVYRKHSNSEWTSKNSSTKYYTSRFVRMEIYKYFLDVNDERSALICLAALRKKLLSDPKLMSFDGNIFKINLKLLRMNYQGVWFHLYYYPVVRKIKRMIRFLIGRKSLKR